MARVPQDGPKNPALQVQNGAEAAPHTPVGAHASDVVALGAEEEASAEAAAGEEEVEEEGVELKHTGGEGGSAGAGDGAGAGAATVAPGGCAAVGAKAAESEKRTRSGGGCGAAPAGATARPAARPAAGDAGWKTPTNQRSSPGETANRMSRGTPGGQSRPPQYSPAASAAS